MKLTLFMLVCLSADVALANIYRFGGQNRLDLMFRSDDEKPDALLEDIASSVFWVQRRSSNMDTQECRGDTCFAELDCFNECTGSFRHIGLLPQNPAFINTKFTFHIRDYIMGIPLTYRDTSNVFGVIYKPTMLYILVHDFGDSANGWPSRLKNSILSMDEQAVVIVDWTGSFQMIDDSFSVYAQAVVNTEIVGRQIAVLVQNLIQDLPFTMQPHYMHFIGHGLGAHTATFFAEYLLKLTGLVVGRITALDPISPLFEEYNVTVGRSTGLFVEVIHTSAPNAAVVQNSVGMALFQVLKVVEDTWLDFQVLRGKLGVMQPIGHLDFYPNGGRLQPGCSFDDNARLCSHNRAYEYLEAAWSPSTDCVFLAFGCNGGREEYLAGKCIKTERRPFVAMNIVNMKSTFAPRGVYFFDVSEKSPYCT